MEKDHKEDDFEVFGDEEIQAAQEIGEARIETKEIPK